MRNEEESKASPYICLEVNALTPTPLRRLAEQGAAGRGQPFASLEVQQCSDRQVAAQASVWLSLSIPRKKVKYLPEAHRGGCGEGGGGGGGDPVTFKGALKA